MPSGSASTANACRVAQWTPDSGKRITAASSAGSGEGSRREDIGPVRRDRRIQPGGTLDGMGDGGVRGERAFCQKVLRKNFGGTLRYMTTFSHLTGNLFGEALTSSPADSPASRSRQPESERVEPMNDISFRKCFELFERSQPRWVVAENVRGLLSIESGAVFAEVISSLEGEGYEVITFCVPASAVGMHRTDETRLWMQYCSGESLGLKLQPAFVEWMMGYPIGYTDLKHSETP
jgi:hypothetical protein